MKRLLAATSLLALILSVLVLPASAFAQQDDQTTKEVTEYTFKGIDLSAKRTMPLDERIEAIRHERTKSLYEARQNWVPELLESSYEL